MESIVICSRDRSDSVKICITVLGGESRQQWACGRILHTNLWMVHGLGDVISYVTVQLGRRRPAGTGGERACRLHGCGPVEPERRFVRGSCSRYCGPRLRAIVSQRLWPRACPIPHGVRAHSHTTCTLHPRAPHADDVLCRACTTVPTVQHSAPAGTAGNTLRIRA